MNLATPADLDTIKSIFAPYAKAYFPISDKIIFAAKSKRTML